MNQTSCFVFLIRQDDGEAASAFFFARPQKTTCRLTPFFIPLVSLTQVEGNIGQI